MTTHPVITFIGIDVAKLSLEASDAAGSRSLALSNDAPGHRKLITWLKTLPAPVRLVCEASGGYEKSLLEALLRANMDVCRVHPGRVRYFARALGRLAKTDPIDASLLATYGQMLAPRPLKPGQPDQEHLRALFDRRQQLVDQRTAERNRAQTAGPVLLSLIQRMIGFLEEQIAEIERLLDQHLEANAPLKAKALRLEQVQGVGRVTSTVLLAHLPELGTLDRRQAAALAGVAPFNRDSGPVQAKRSIAGGRSLVRKILYMAATTAAQHNPILRAFYQRLLAHGKKPKVALVAVMRKLIVLLNHLLKNPHFSLA